MLAISKLRALEDKYLDLEAKISDPEVIANQPLWQQYTKEHARLEEVVAAFREYRDKQQSFDEAEAILKDGSDPELADLAREEIKELKPELEGFEKRLTILLLPKDPNDEKNVILEIRAGTGGDEAGLFAADLFRMYARFAEMSGWRVEALSSSAASGMGGFKEIIFSVEGTDVYKTLRYESGGHRVQRVPATEAQGPKRRGWPATVRMSSW